MNEWPIALLWVKYELYDIGIPAEEETEVYRS
jgi:hypothetical protein